MHNSFVFAMRNPPEKYYTLLYLIKPDSNASKCTKII